MRMLALCNELFPRYFNAIEMSVLLGRRGPTCVVRVIRDRKESIPERIIVPEPEIIPHKVDNAINRCTHHTVGLALDHSSENAAGLYAIHRH